MILFEAENTRADGAIPGAGLRYSHGDPHPLHFFSESAPHRRSAVRRVIGCPAPARECRFGRVTSPDERGSATDRRWLISWGTACGSLAAFVSQVPLAGIPHVTDEVAYTLQARLFAAGQRLGPAADNASMCMLPFWNNDGPMFSPFPPGWPASGRRRIGGFGAGQPAGLLALGGLPGGARARPNGRTARRGLDGTFPESWCSQAREWLTPPCCSPSGS